MNNSTAKGNQHEIEVKKHLELEGWAVFRVHKKAIYIPGKGARKGCKKACGCCFRGNMILVGADAFGSDLICKKKGEKTRWIQVGAEGAKSKKEKQLLEHTWNLDHETAEVWLRIEGKKAYRVFLLERVDTPDTGPRESFVDSGLVEIRCPSAKARARLLPGGAGFVR